MSTIYGNPLLFGGGLAKRLEFSYTGTYNERLEDGVVELLTSGILKFKKETAIDAFLVGGGSSGQSGSRATSGSIGGGKGGCGGTTKTLLNIIPRANTEYSIVIGAGGAAAYTKDHKSQESNPGGDTIAFGSTAAGGTVTSGGSGGGAGSRASAAANGGSDGADGGAAGNYAGGKGQGTTTREFGEETGKLYAGGGGGGDGASGSKFNTYGTGGAGGGGNGAAYVYTTNYAPSGTDNTGGGGGGACGSIVSSDNFAYSGVGGSGIVCIRLHKES